jgi:hypothetical protein
VQTAVETGSFASARAVAATRVRRATAALVGAALVAFAVLAGTGRSTAFLPVAVILGWTQLAGL